MRRILVFTVDLIPLPGHPVYGGGLRAWGLGQALAAAGHEVLYSVPRELIEGRDDVPEEMVRLAFRTGDLHEIVAAAQPDILLFEQWGLLEYLHDEGLPTIVDIHGSLILENAFRGQLNWSVNAEAKIKALRKADLVLVPGRRQADYIKPWLLLAGENPRSLPVAIVPVSMPPDLPERTPATRKVGAKPRTRRGEARRAEAGEPIFVHGGNLWPWIDPLPALEVVAEVLERRDLGRLLLFTGHPKRASVLPQEPPAVADPSPRLARVRAHARVDELGFVPRDELLRHYLGATAAIDVYRQNAERDLAITTRTIEYLWAGLPVLHAAYAELAPTLAAADAGWIVDPDDRDGIARVLDSILDDPDVAARKGENARRLVRERFTWDRTIAPVDAFCRDPVRRGKGRPIFAQLQREFDGLRREWDGRREEFQATIGKLSTELTHMAQRCESLTQNTEAGRDDLRLKNEEIVRVTQKLDSEIRWRDDEIRRLGHEMSEECRRRDEALRSKTEEAKDELRLKSEEILRITQKLDQEIHWRDDEIRRSAEAKAEECRWRDGEIRKKDDEVRAVHLDRARDIRELNEQIVTRDRRIQELSGDLDRTRQSAAALESRIVALEAELQGVRVAAEAERTLQEAAAIALEQERSRLEGLAGALAVERDDARTDADHLREVIARVQQEFTFEREGQSQQRDALKGEIAAVRAEVEGLRGEQGGLQQAIRDRDERIRWLEGVLFSLKNRLPYKTYKFATFWTRRLVIQIPTLIVLYVVNFVSNIYMHWWTQRHRQQVFPGM